jgi:hypothetical protein
MSLQSPPRAATGAGADGRYRPADPAAYAPVALVPRRDVVRAIAVQLAITAPLLVWHGPLALVAAGALTALHARRVRWSWRRRGEAPFVVDRPGVFVAGAAPGEPGRVVHWESIESIVLCEMTSRRSRHRRRVPGIALRLRHHPEVAAIRRPLDDRPVDRGQLLAAVTRYAPPGVAVDLDGPPLADTFTARDVAADLARRAVRRAARPRRSRPGDAGPSLRLAVEAGGVRLGPRGRLVPWREVAAVVVLDVEEGTGWHRAVGLAPAGAPPGTTRLLAHEVARDWRLDRPALEAAVRRHAPHVPVVDGAPIRRAGVGDVADAAAALARAYRGRRVPQRHAPPRYEPGSPLPDAPWRRPRGSAWRARWRPTPSDPQGVSVIRTDRRRSGRARTSSDRGSPTSR